MLRVLLSAPYMVPFADRFAPLFKHYGVEIIVPDVHERMEEEDLLPYAGQIDGTICGDDRYSEAVIRSFVPRLKIISKWGTGIDSINKPAAESLGVMVGNTPNAFTLPVSDSVLAYILAFARQQPWMDRLVKSGRWEKIPGRSLSECTLGVIGVGNIGKAVLRRALGFGMRLLGNDIIDVGHEIVHETGVRMVALEDLLARADFVSLNCDLNPTSLHLMNAERLALMKPTSVLINTSRGPVVDEPALIRALESKRIAGAGLDVFEEEPLPAESPLRKMDNVMLAAHNSNSSPTAWERVHWNTIRNLLIGLKIPCDDLEEWMEKI